MKQVRLSERVVLNILFVIVLCVFIATNYYTYHQAEKVAASHEWVKHTHQVMESINNVLLDVSEIESLTRGYLITNDKSFIDTIDEKISVIFKNYKKTQFLVKNNPLQKQILNSLEPVLIERMNVIKQSIQNKTENKLQNHVALPLLHRAQNLTEKIKQIIKEFYQNEVMLLNQREEAFIKNYNETNFYSALIDIINLLLLITIMMLFNRMFTKLMLIKNQSKNSESLLNGIINGSKDYITALDLNYKFIAVNEACKREFRHIFGKHLKTGMTLKESLAHLPEEQEKALTIWNRALQGEDFTVIQEFGANEQTRNKYELTYSPIYDDKNKLIGAAQIARNMGKRLEEELQLKIFNENLEKSLRNVEKRAKEMSTLNDMNIKLRSCASLEETLSVTTLYLKQLFPVFSGIIFIMNHSKNYLEAISEWNDPELAEKVFSPDECWGLRQGKIYLYLNSDESIPCKHLAKNTHQHPYFCIPLLALNEVVGVLNLQVKPDMGETNIVTFFENNSSMIQNLSGQIALSISNIRLNEALKLRSTRDILTNLYNRSYLEDTFERDVQRAKRKNSPIATIMMDLDFFKKVNDTFGHDAGDIVLREVCKLLENHLRQSDIACRYGGEEIIILLYDTTLEDAVTKIEKFRKSISELEFRFVDLLTITASFGIAMFPIDGENSEQLIKAADNALYHSKKTGRNKITTYQELKNV